MTHIRSQLLVLVLTGCASISPSSVPASGAPASGALTEVGLYQTLSPSGREAVDRAPVVPLFFGTISFGTGGTGRGAVVTAGPHFYAVSLHRDGHSLALHGVDQVHAQIDDETGSEGTPPSSNTTVRGRPATILVNEGIRSVAWEEDGAYWSLEVECDRPFDDPRCTEDTYLSSEAEALVDLRGSR